MQETDERAFVVLIGATRNLYSKETDPATISLMFGLLRDYELSEIKEAIEAHCYDPEEGRFCPSPAHLIGRIKVARQREGAVFMMNRSITDEENRRSFAAFVEARDAAIVEALPGAVENAESVGKILSKRFGATPAKSAE